MTQTEQNTIMPVEVVDRQTSVEVFHLLSEPLPIEALSIDDSRGVPLTSIKQAYVLERLQETFGLVGYGWRYAFGPFWREMVGNNEEILVEVAVQWRITDDMDRACHCPPVYWQRAIHPETGAIVEGWQYAPGPAVWSEPVFTKGGSSTNRRGNVRATDAHRSAETNALTKAGARLGIGQEVYKDQDELSLALNKGDGKPRRERPARESRQSGAKKRPVTTPKNGGSFADLEAIRQAAQAEVGKLTFADAAPEAKTVQQLAHGMDSMGFKMQAQRLVFVLLGEGGFTQKGVMAVHNLLLKGKLSEANITLLNEAAFQ